ncbi:hypothetical protein HOLleu_13048 [Holothuria leucospilota]|uniref:Uncharacterized protein n=1 Tax=Holothuria leucospilota TaxID=206669 RepID=A0A9Q1CB43_HOLLE|nr:hypothetical protein HOLleu_13048 [Holothuria leucospilota]
MPPSKLKEKCNKYPKPENIDLIQVTQINRLIWDNLQVPTRTRDIKLQKIQMLSLKAMTALTSILNDSLVSKANIDKESVLTKITDCMVLLGSANRDLNQFRRELIRPEMKAEYKALFGKPTGSSKFLFGDDISQQLRDIADANKLSKRCMYPSRGNARGRGSGKIRGRGRPDHRYQPFLDKRQNQAYSRGRGRGRGRRHVA